MEKDAAEKTSKVDKKDDIETDKTSKAEDKVQDSTASQVLFIVDLDVAHRSLGSGKEIRIGQEELLWVRVIGLTLTLVTSCD
jgi:hypothetical protein